MPAATCVQCFHAFVSTKNRVDAAARARKERSIRRRRTRLIAMGTGGSALLPGAGHFFVNAPVWGVSLSFVSFVLIGIALHIAEVAPLPRPAGALQGWAPFVGVGAVVALVWLISMITVAAAARVLRGGRI